MSIQLSSRCAKNAHVDIIVSMKDEALLRSYLFKLGLSVDAAKLYIALIRYGAQSISELSRNSRIERTRVYRTLPELDSAGLVHIRSDGSSQVISANPFDNVHVLLSKREQELDDLRRYTPRVAMALRELASTAPKSDVKVYRGAEGIKQMLWNETKADTELLSVLTRGTQVYTKQKFFDRWVRACNDRGLSARSIVSNDFTQSLDEWRSRHESERLATWTGRSVDQDTFKIEHDMIIYDNVVGYFSWDDGDVFGIEIHNQVVASMQRQFFELLWGMAQEINRKAD